MSTRIDIQIGQALLMDRLRGVAGLNREQRLERERQAKEQAQIKVAADKAVAERAKAGIETSADKAERKSGVPEYYTPPKVAATWRQGKAWLLVPSDAGFNAIVRGVRPFAFTDTLTDEMLYAPGSGPSSANALYVSSNPAGGLSEYFAELVALSGVSEEPAGKAFTFELIAKLPTEDASTRPYSDTYAHIARNSVSIYASLGDYGTFIGDVYTPRRRIDFKYGGLLRKVWSESSIYVYPEDVISSSATAADVWHHIAIVQTPGASSNLRNVAFYIDGTRYFNEVGLSADTIAMPVWDPGLFTSDTAVENRYGKSTFVAGAIPFKPTLTHGIRFTSRALYTGTSFTPPTSLATLA